MKARKMVVGVENIGLERMDALLFIAHTKRKLSIFLFFSSHKYITMYCECFLMKFVAIVMASFEVYRNLQRKVLKSIFNSF